MGPPVPSYAIKVEHLPKFGVRGGGDWPETLCHFA